MDRPLDDIIQSRQRTSRPSNSRPPRDGVRKTYQKPEARSMDRDWVHDRYDEDSDSRPSRDSRPTRGNRRDTNRDPLSLGSKIRIENIHWDLTEDDLKELFSRIGEVKSMQLVYDRQDRSTGVAYVVYFDSRDARTAVQEFDGANANGQPIKLTLVPSGPNKPRNPFDNVERPTRSLFDRVERRTGGDSEDERPSRRTNTRRPPPENVDRYVPGQGDSREPSDRRSPRRDARDGRGRGGRRPGQRRPREARDTDGHLIVQGRPRKTAEELDDEMSDYWGKKQGDAAPENGKAVNPLDGDVDMDI